MDDAQALRVLTQRLPAPTHRPAPPDWAAVTARLGTALPAGYRRFCERWGRVRINDDLNVEAPADDERSGLVGFVRSHSAIHRDLRDDLGAGPALWPEPGGLLPWGWLDDGTTVLWSPVGEPDMWTVVLRRDDEQAGDHGQLTDTGQRSLAFVADWVARSQHDRLDVTFVDADRTRWMGRGEPDDVDLGADREGDHWHLFLTLGDVLELPRERALEGFLAHLEVERPRLREAIVESRVRHSREELIVSGGWRSQRRCQQIRDAAIRYADRHAARPDI